MTCGQVQTLLWKCWIRRKRNSGSTLVQFLLPVITCLFAASIWASLPGVRRDQPGPTGNGTGGPFLYETWDQMTGGVYFQPGRSCSGTLTIYFTPNNTFTRNITDDILRVCVNIDNKWRVVATSTVDEMNRLLTEQAALIFSEINYESAAGVIFDLGPTDGEISAIPKQFNYTIRAVDSNQDHRLFVSLQMAINEAYLNELAKESLQNDRLSSAYRVEPRRFPYPRRPAEEFAQDPSYSIMTLILVYGGTFMATQIVKQIAEESSSKIKELLRMMGMSDWVFWLSHFVDFFILMLLQTVVISFLARFAFLHYSIFLYTDWSLMLFFMTLSNIQTILFCQAISTIFNKPIIGTIAAAIIWIAAYELPNQLLFPETEFDFDKNSLRVLTCFLPQMAIKWFFTFVKREESFDCHHYEAAQIGLKLSNFLNTTEKFKSFTSGIVVLMMLLSYLFYIIFIWYVDAVWPWQMGVPKPWYFPFTKDYWSPKWENVEEKSKLSDQENIEEPPANCVVGMSVKNLSKKFNSNYVVKNLYLDIYHGNINVLLGHNGAGKTTTMNMMTGIFPPTSGTVIVDSYDIRKQTKQARQSMGMCTQDNVYYSDLTVEEHLIIFASIKGCPKHEVDVKVRELLRKLKLLDKTNVMAESLSGGMKRRLMLAIAMVNDTKILILDEPTSGLDPESRRIVWDVLLETRAQRTILLSTHYMEEAETLGDRISIMSSGQLVCSGTAMFLKKRFSIGYRLQIAKQESFDHKEVNEIIRKHVSSATIQSEIPTEIVYLLTAAENEDETKIKSRFSDLFDELEQTKSQLGIDSYGISVNTIEEVFLKVGDVIQTNEQKEIEAKKDLSIEFKPELFEKRIFGFGLTKNRFIALLKKRFLIAKRHWKMMLLQLVIPCVVLICSLLLFGGSRSRPSNETIQYDIGLHSPTESFFQDLTGQNFTDLGLAYQKVARRRQVTTHFINQDALEWTLQRAELVGIQSYNTKLLTGLVVRNEDQSDHTTRLVLQSWFNPGTWQLFENNRGTVTVDLLPSMAMAINTMFEAVANYRRPENDSITIMASNQPFTTAHTESVFHLMETFILRYFLVSFIMMTFLFTFLSASFILEPIDENQKKFKLLQLMTGLPSTLFWLANFVFDMIFYLLVVFLLFLILFIFDFRSSLLSSISALPLFITLLLFGFSSIPFAYFCSLYSSTPANGFQFILFLSLIIGFVAIPTVKIGAFSVENSELTLLGLITIKTFFKHANWIVSLIPTGSMLFSVQAIYFNNSMIDICRRINATYQSCESATKIQSHGKTLIGCCPSLCQASNSCYHQTNYFAFDNGLSKYFLVMFVIGLVLFIFVCLKDSNLFNVWLSSNEAKQNVDIATDSDVKNEQNRIYQLEQDKQLDSEALGVIELKKSFGNLSAVDGLTFGVHKEECFGLLGVNGAGKTTTFRMLVGDLDVNSGNAFIDNISLKKNLKMFQKKIGYCPQFDALNDYLTVHETIELFAILRGISRKDIKSAVNQLIEMVDLQDHVFKRTTNLSGGNKRKLSLAVAIIGCPPVVFLDEPTSGVDPAARRKIWSTLVFIQDKLKCSVILTSHSMDECEALCSRITIMVNGKFQCLGSSQHLKVKFGQGFEIRIKLKNDQSQNAEYLKSLEEMVLSEFGSAVLKEHHQTLIQFHVSDAKTLWADLFRKMEQLKTSAGFEDYTISDTNLEQVFLMFARKQKNTQ